MAAVETMSPALLPVAPLMRDILDEIPPPSCPENVSGTVQESVPEESQEAILESALVPSEQSPLDMAKSAVEEGADASSLSQDLPPQRSPSKPIMPVQKDLSTFERVSFDPSKHIQFTPPTKVWTMKELDYPDGKGISPIGVSEPFPLFSKEAIGQMRAEIFSEQVWDKYQFSSNLSHCQLRGYAPECAPFMYDAWRSPEVLAIVSQIAGIELVPVMDWEIGHVNIAVHTEEEKAAALEVAQRAADEGVAGCPFEDKNPVVDWHTDSYPFVCVTMLSDCTGMIGGETALRKGNGGVIKVRGPQMGSAVILQGRYIEHQALRALGTTERITSVTSFRPRSPSIRDDTVLTTVRPISDLGELYHQYTEYRFEILQDRLQNMGRELRNRQRTGRKYEAEQIKGFIREQIDFLNDMIREVINEDQVRKGYIGDSHLISDEIKESSKKKGTYDKL